MVGQVQQTATLAVNIVEEIDCSSFFDELIDFPAGDIDNTLLHTDNKDSSFLNGSSFPDIWSIRDESDSVFSHTGNNNGSSNSDLSAELSVPYEDIVQLEWLSSFVEDSFSEGTLAMSKLQDSYSENKDSSMSSHPFQTPSPISVLESSSSCSGSDKSTGPHSPTEIIAPSKSCGRARSKRPRPATFASRPIIPMPNNEESFAESQLVIKIPKHVLGVTENKIKKKKMKPKVPVPNVEEADQHASQLQNVRKCMHCEVTKTPQWRSGPMGPKTLCNACGVRYKSGRLFPEYRPAASPTFVPTLHSNSHKKVLEMRTSVPNNFATNSPELIPNNNSHLAIEYM